MDNLTEGSCLFKFAAYTSPFDGVDDNDGDTDTDKVLRAVVRRGRTTLSLCVTNT